jgi:predicted metal-dependent phosphoesterase TrpH
VPVDLHLHSTNSDGTSTPEEIVQAAVSVGLSAIALTDHDNLDGIPAARTAAGSAGLGFIPGTELSVGWEGSAMHLLVYFLEPEPGPLQDRLSGIRDGRTTRNHEIIAALQDLGIDISYDEVATEATGASIGRPHIAAVLVAKGVVADIPAAFDRLLAAGRPAYRPRLRLEASEAITLARASGAVPVIAHPHTLGIPKGGYRDAFRDLVEQGLGGIEAYYGEYRPELRRHLAQLCDDLGIVATGGSDYHGSYKPDLSVGTGRGDLRVPDETVDKLIEERNGPPLQPR